MRILWILPYSPWPTTSGGKTRQYHLLRSLAARGHRITVLLHSKQPVSAEDRRALEPFLERLVVLPRRPLRSLSTLLAALFAPYPLLASVNGLSAELQRTATELLREPWDVVQVEHSYSFQPYERPLRDAGQPFVLTEHNVESSLGAATYDRLPGWALPFVRYDQWRYRRWERRVMSQAAAVVAVTERCAAARRDARAPGASGGQRGRLRALRRRPADARSAARAVPRQLRIRTERRCRGMDARRDPAAGLGTLPRGAHERLRLRCRRTGRNAGAIRASNGKASFPTCCNCNRAVRCSSPRCAMAAVRS